MPAPASLYLNIVLLVPPYSTLTYRAPAYFPEDFWKPGLRVAVPLGRSYRLCAAYIESATRDCPLKEPALCKEVFWPLEKAPLLSSRLLDLAQDLAGRQGVPVGSVLGHVLPAGLRSPGVVIGNAAMQWDLPELAGRPNISEIATALENGEYEFFPQRAAESEKILRLKVDPPWPVRPGARKQREILDFLYAHGMVSRRFLATSVRNCQPALKSLVKGGLVGTDPVPEERTPISPPREWVLNEGQSAALAAIAHAVAEGQPASLLLHGVTGSGKTAVYMEALARNLAKGRGALLLAPEVALAQKLFAETASHFTQVPVVLYHGYQTPRTREEIWRRIAPMDQPAIVVGTRSAMFLPLKDPGLIILDEEHDSSWKQDENFYYHAKEIAWWLSNSCSGVLVLGSATPDIRTFHAAREGKIPCLSLPTRVAGGQLPEVELAELAPSRSTISSILAPATEKALQECLARGEQAVVLLNRRGYSPFIHCLDCKRTLRCPQCEIALTYHRATDRLVCHYCGHSEPFPTPCPTCGNMNYLPLGEGTEKLEEHLEALAGCQVMRLDRDSARRPERLKEILNDFAAGKSPFLVGTQMLSKGHHFPNVTLSVIADGDIGLNLPDYRAAEKTFQLMVQAAGRAGRGQKPGRVIIQTRDDSHYCWQYVCSHDYTGFYEEELSRRRRRNYPPFTNLGLLRISYAQNNPAGARLINDLAPVLRSRARELRIQFLGPAPAPLGIIRGRRRMQCLLKCENWAAMRALYFTACSASKGDVLRISLDLDPVDML